MIEMPDRRASDAGSPSEHLSDTELLEEALRDAMAAHAAGLLAAPFGLDLIALARARHRAALADTQQRPPGKDPNPDTA